MFIGTVERITTPITLPSIMHPAITRECDHYIYMSIILWKISKISDLWKCQKTPKMSKCQNVIITKIPELHESNNFQFQSTNLLPTWCTKPVSQNFSHLWESAQVLLRGCVSHSIQVRKYLHNSKIIRKPFGTEWNSFNVIAKFINSENSEKQNQ